MAQRVLLSGGSKLIRLAGYQCVSFSLAPDRIAYDRVDTAVNDRPVTVTPSMRDAP